MLLTRQRGIYGKCRILYFIQLVGHPWIYRFYRRIKSIALIVTTNSSLYLQPDPIDFAGWRHEIGSTQ